MFQAETIAARFVPFCNTPVLGSLTLQQPITKTILAIQLQLIFRVSNPLGRLEFLNAAALERTAHAIKGSLSNFAASEAFQAAQKLESMGGDRDPGQAGVANGVLERQLLALQSSLSIFQKERVS